MTRAVDAPATLGNALVVDRHDEDGTIVVETTLGGVTQRVTVAADWWDEHTPEPTP